MKKKKKLTKHTILILIASLIWVMAPFSVLFFLTLYERLTLENWRDVLPYVIFLSSFMLIALPLATVVFVQNYLHRDRKGTKKTIHKSKPLWSFFFFLIFLLPYNFVVLKHAWQDLHAEPQQITGQCSLSFTLTYSRRRFTHHYIQFPYADLDEKKFLLRRDQYLASGGVEVESVTTECEKQMTVTYLSALRIVLKVE